jgi:hypothetical protein
MIELVGQERHVSHWLCVVDVCLCSVMERLEAFMAEADDLGDDILRVTVYEGALLLGTTSTCACVRVFDVEC